MTRNPKAHQTVLFDLDGTLIDSIGLIIECYQHAAEVHLGRRLSESAILEGLGSPLHIEFSKWAKHAEQIEAMISTYRERNLSRHDSCVKAFPGACESIDTLARRGANLGIVTSKPGTTARRGLRVCGFGDVFEVVIGSTDVERHKPHPEPVHRALEALGASPRDTVYVGDSPHDLEAGREAGVRTAAALWGPFARDTLLRMKPDYVLESPSDIAEL